MQEIDWSVAKRWWPYALMRSIDRPMGLTEESLFRSPVYGGRVPDPKKAYASVTVFYWNQKASPFRDYYTAVWAAGGIQMNANFYPPGETVKWTGSFGRRAQVPVVVRGHPARMIEFRKGENANINWRAVRWEETQPTGGVVQWEISDDSQVYSRQETIDFINALVAA